MWRSLKTKRGFGFHFQFYLVSTNYMCVCATNISFIHTYNTQEGRNQTSHWLISMSLWMGMGAALCYFSRSYYLFIKGIINIDILFLKKHIKIFIDFSRDLRLFAELRRWMKCLDWFMRVCGSPTQFGPLKNSLFFIITLQTHKTCLRDKAVSRQNGWNSN